MKIPFSPPYIDQSVIDEVTDTLKSGWITSGPKGVALEESIAEFCGAKRVLCVNSWTSGAILVLKWMGLKEGDEVIVPAYTYSATALAVYHAGGTPVMVDTADDFNISLEAVRRAITPRTKAIIPVDIAGYPNEYDKIMQMVQDETVIAMFQPTSPVQEKLGRILVLNDAAHSLGAWYNKHKGLRTGAETDVAIFSLHAVKNVTTAEGGAICLNLPPAFDANELYTTLRQMSLNCQTKDALSKSKAGGWRYDITDIGLKINMADVNAAIGLAQMRIYNGNLLPERRRVFDLYNRRFEQQPWAVLPPLEHADGRISSCHLYALRIKGIEEAQRDAIIDHIAQKGVAVNVHFIPMPMLTAFKHRGFNIENYPQAYANYKGEISLPIYPQLTDEMVNFVADAVIEAYHTVIGG